MRSSVRDFPSFEPHNNHRACPQTYRRPTGILLSWLPVREFTVGTQRTIIFYHACLENLIFDAGRSVEKWCFSVRRTANVVRWVRVISILTACCSVALRYFRCCEIQAFCFYTWGVEFLNTADRTASGQDIVRIELISVQVK